MTPFRVHWGHTGWNMAPMDPEWVHSDLSRFRVCDDCLHHCPACERCKLWQEYMSKSGDGAHWCAGLKSSDQGPVT